MAVQTLKHMAFREQLWDTLQYARGLRGQIFSYIMIVLILLSVGIIPLDFIGGLNEFAGILVFIEVFLTVVFTIEYVARLYAAPNRLKYIFSFFGIIDLLSILPFYLGLLPTQYVRVIHLVRVVRVLKISRIEAAASVNKDSAEEVGLLPGEVVEHVVTRHPFIFMLGLFPVMAAISVGMTVLLLFSQNAVTVAIAFTLFIFAFVFLLKAFLDYNFDVIYVTSHRLIFQNRHLLGRNTNQVSYRSITNVKPRYTGIWSYILGFGNIVIETPAEGGGKIEQTYVRGHETAAKHIMNRCFVDQSQNAPREFTPLQQPQNGQMDQVTVEYVPAPMQEQAASPPPVQPQSAPPSPPPPPPQQQSPAPPPPPPPQPSTPPDPYAGPPGGTPAPGTVPHE